MSDDLKESCKTFIEVLSRKAGCETPDVTQYFWHLVKNLILDERAACLNICLKHQGEVAKAIELEILGRAS